MIPWRNPLHLPFIWDEVSTYAQTMGIKTYHKTKAPEVLLVALRTGVDILDDLAFSPALIELCLEGAREPLALRLHIREPVDEHELRVCPPNSGGQASLYLGDLTRVRMLAVCVPNKVCPFGPLRWA
jgi:hypothetical protein